MQIYEDVDAVRLRHWKPARDRTGEAGCMGIRSLVRGGESRPCSRDAEWSVSEMACFDYGAAAELFPGRHKTRMIGAVTYKRFTAAAEAIRYAVEVLPASSFLGAFLEVNEERFNSNEIRQLYESVEYPLPRQGAAIRDRLLSVKRAA